MTPRERRGLIILIGLFLVFGALLFFTVKRPSSAGYSLQNNVIIEQRLSNIKKQR